MQNIMALFNGVEREYPKKSSRIMMPGARTIADTSTPDIGVSPPGQPIPEYLIQLTMYLSNTSHDRKTR